jgi:DNA-binding CsgD family transcriptional regulator
MLQRPAALAEIGAIASSGHERVDGSGYPRGAAAGSGALSKLLAAADAYHAMCEDRPHRPAREPNAAAALLRAECRAGRFDPAAVDAVLAAAGHGARRAPGGPAGLTRREIEVLVLVARGASNRHVADSLGITPRTAGSHIEHIYTKIGVSTRAAAALFAIQHGLLPDLVPLDA